MPSPEQLRASAILAFQEELARLQAEGVLSLDAAALERVRAHHDAELARLAAGGDLDLTPTTARLSTGMRVATLLGTIALSAAYAFFVSSHWGALDLGMQLVLVIVPPLLLAALTHLAARQETSGYVASILATVAAIAFATNLGTLGSLFNLPGSRNALLAVGVFAMLLAYGYGLTLPLLVGIGGIGGWVWTLGAVPLGLWWDDGFSVLEPLLVVGLLALMAPEWMRGPARFAPWWRGAGAAALVLGVIVLGEAGQLSIFRSANTHTLEIAYQMLGLVVLAALIAWGLLKDRFPVMQIGSAGAVLYLFLRLVHWFWDLLPRWLFFLVVGGFALAVLLILRRARQMRLVAR